MRSSLSNLLWQSMTRYTGIALVLVSAASFGTLAILGRFAYADGLDTFTILFYRFLIAALVMFVWVVARHEPMPRGTVLVKLAGMGALGYVGQAYLYLTALKYASPGLVALLLYLYPVFVVMLSALLLRERLTPLKLLALGMALSGVALTVSPGSGDWRGILMAVGAALVYSVYIMVGAGVLKQVSAIQSTTVIFTAAGGMAGILMLVNGPHLPESSGGWLAIGLIVLIATILPVVTFMAGLERVGPANAAMLSTLEPAVTVLLAAWILHEPPQLITLLGGLLILAAVVLLSWSELSQGGARRDIRGQL